MNNFKKISISTLEMEMPALEADAEGKLRGGFGVATFSEGTKFENGNCGCPVASSSCSMPKNDDCGDVSYTNGNCNCGTKLPTKPDTTTKSSADAGQNFTMGFSMLF